MRLPVGVAERITRLGGNTDFTKFYEFLTEVHKKAIRELVTASDEDIKLKQGEVRMVEKIINAINDAPKYRQQH